MSVVLVRFVILVTVILVVNCTFELTIVNYHIQVVVVALLSVVLVGFVILVTVILVVVCILLFSLTAFRGWASVSSPVRLHG